MRSKKGSLSVIAAAIAVAVFSVVNFGQDTKTETPKAEATEKRAHRGERTDGEFGRKGRMEHMGPRGGMGMHGLGIRGVDLTDAQREQIKGIMEANKMDPALREELRTIHESRKSGTELTAEQKARIDVIRDQMRTKSQNVHDQIQNVLTAEQKAQITKNREEMKQHRELMHQQFKERRNDRPARPASPIESTRPAETIKPSN